jgi:hypothetical protein
MEENILTPDIKSIIIPKGVAPKKLRKVSEAEDFVKNGEILRALKIYKDLCLGTLQPEDKIEVVVSFLKTIPDEGREMLIRWRDMITFASKKELEQLKRLMVLVSENPDIDSHERSMTAVTLYNHAFLDVCFKCFESIAFDRSVLVKYRVDACRYLVGSEDQNNKEVAQECLIEILEDRGLPSEFRYSIIAGFISRTGISTYLNATKIKIPYDEEFVYGLQTNFFYEEKNGVRERILSGQHILDMSLNTSSEEEKEKIGSIILGIASNLDYDENIRADAADVILRMGTSSQIKEAREIITSLGFSGINSKMGILDRVKTIYNNSQNMHDEKIGESVSKFIEKIINEPNIKTRPFHEIQNEVSDLIRSKGLPGDKKHSAFKALNRVSIDTATFTKYRVSIADIFVHIWVRIQKYEKETKEMLEKRLLEELIEMGDTCSSGHSGRFVNVLSGVDSDLRISYGSQITANLAGRINARVRKTSDSDIRAAISSGMLPEADETDKEIYKNFIIPTLKELKDELQSEFVGEKYISQEEFNVYFNEAEKMWLSFTL